MIGSLQRLDAETKKCQETAAALANMQTKLGQTEKERDFERRKLKELEREKEERKMAAAENGEAVANKEKEKEEREREDKEREEKRKRWQLEEEEREKRRQQWQKEDEEREERVRGEERKRKQEWDREEEERRKSRDQEQQDSRERREQEKEKEKGGRVSSTSPQPSHLSEQDKASEHISTSAFVVQFCTVFPRASTRHFIRRRCSPEDGPVASVHRTLYRLLFFNCFVLLEINRITNLSVW